jgi:hypothetical protein
MLADKRSASDAQPSRKLACRPKDARVMTQQSNFDSTFVTMCPLARCSRRLTAAGPTSAVDPKRSFKKPMSWTPSFAETMIDHNRSGIDHGLRGVAASSRLGQYEAVFRDNGVDGAVLPKLTVDDIKELGVAGVGHRRKIIAAIEELNASTTAHAGEYRRRGRPARS